MEIRLDQILFQLINFGVVLGALVYLLYKPVLKMLDERAEKIARAEKAAEETMQERSEVEKMKEKAKLQGEKEAAKVVEKAKEQANELKKDLSSKVKEEVKTERERALQAIEKEKKAMQASAQKEMTEAVFAVTEKVLGKALDKKAHADLVSKSMKELASIM